MAWKNIREKDTGKLLFRFDEESDTIEIQRRGNKTTVKLDDLREENASERQRERQRRN
jgi:hypothetical protein